MLQINELVFNRIVHHMYYLRINIHTNIACVFNFNDPTTNNNKSNTDNPIMIRLRRSNRMNQHHTTRITHFITYHFSLRYEPSNQSKEIPQRKRERKKKPLKNLNFCFLSEFQFPCGGDGRESRCLKLESLHQIRPISD